MRPVLGTRGNIIRSFWMSLSCIRFARSAVLSAVLLSSCAATGPKFELETPPVDKALVYIFRPPGWTGIVRQTNISIDKVPFIRLGKGSYTTVRLSPGPHQFERSMSAWPGDLKAMTDPQSITADLKAGQVYFIVHDEEGKIGGQALVMGRVATVPLAFRFNFGFVDGNQAIEALRGCNYQTPE